MFGPSFDPGDFINPAALGTPYFEPIFDHVIIEEFLAPAEIAALTEFALANESRFHSSLVVRPGAEDGTVDVRSRKSRVLDDLGTHAALFRHRVARVLPYVLERFGLEPVPPRVIDVQMTASGDGDFFRLHSDNGGQHRSRRLSYVYFFHAEPPGFEGGGLRLHQAGEAQRSRGKSRARTVAPRQNQIVFFPSHVLHEIMPVSVPSRKFADSRFTLNGWIHW
jgi:Rps23 Pro-64 3,4-dihydroxylase Tpa1-like proline 4-hydroxylase